MAILGRMLGSVARSPGRRAAAGGIGRGYLVRIVRRALILWLLLRSIYVVFVAFAVSIPVYAAIALSARAAAAIVIVATTLALLDARAGREHVFYGNLAISPRWVGGVSFATAAAAELIARLVLGSPPAVLP